MLQWLWRNTLVLRYVTSAKLSNKDLKKNAKRWKKRRLPKKWKMMKITQKLRMMDLMIGPIRIRRNKISRSKLMRKLCLR